MELKLGNSEDSHPSDSHQSPLDSLVEHKKALLNSLRDELYYANLEFKLVNHLFELNSPPAPTDQNETGLSGNDNRNNLLKFGSNDYYETQDKWRDLLSEAFDELRESQESTLSMSKNKSDLDSAYDTLLKLQNSYFMAVQQRETNMKLLLRLKMYTNNRLKLLEDCLKSHEALAEYRPLYTETSAKLVYKNLRNEVSRRVGSDFKQVLGAAKEDASPSQQPSGPTLCKSKPPKFKARALPVFRSPYSSHLLNVFALTNSLDEFKASAKAIYQKYGKNYMTFNVFNNVVMFLFQSLHLPNRIPTDHIYNVYNVNSSSVLDFRTFSLLVLHTLRRAIEAYYHPQYIFRPADMHLNLAVDDSYPFVNISGKPPSHSSDHYSFIKRLSPGKSCNKYVAKELETNELRVVELFCKSPDLPLFHEIHSEVEHLKQLDHKNLVKYIAAYHDYNTVYIVSEFCPELSLLTKLSSLDSNGLNYSLQFVHSVFTQVVEALVFLHCNNLTYKCLNPDNVMLDDSSQLPTIKLRGYGLDLFDDYKHESHLTVLHYAPEAVDGNFSHKTDVWSAGVLLLFLLTGQLPNPSLKKAKFVETLPDTLENSKLFELDDDATDLVSYMLSYDPNLRPSSFEVVSHPWYSATNLPKLPANTKYLSRYVNELLNTNNYRNVTRLLESRETVFVSRLNKLMSALVLSAEPNDGDLVTYGNFVKALKIEGVPGPLISELVHLTSLKDSDKCSLKEFFVACKYWRFGEINILWSICKKSIDAYDWSFDRSEFEEILHESKTGLLADNEIAEVCRAIEVNDRVFWNHFVNLFF